jgi:GT2 family glycosyltransferase
MSQRSGFKLWLLIPVFGNWEDTSACLQALARQNCMDFHVLIADDGSITAPPPDIFGHPFVEYHHFSHRGFVHTCNQAAEWILMEGATHILLLNNDTLMEPDFIDTCLDYLNANPNVILHPVIYWQEHPTEVWFSGGKHSVLVPFLRLTGVPNKPRSVDIASGCCLAIPSGAWRQLGGFRDLYETYYEDFDFCMRARKAGIDIIVHPKWVLFHKVSRSFPAGHVWEKHYKLIRSSLLFIRHHFTGWRKWFCLGLKAVHIVYFMIGCWPEKFDRLLLYRAITEGMTLHFPEDPHS